VCQIQRFDFDCNLVVTRKLIIWTHPPLRLKPLYPVETMHAAFLEWFLVPPDIRTLPLL
jgi:hypothetical protein